VHPLDRVLPPGCVVMGTNWIERPKPTRQAFTRHFLGARQATV
jgi:hypothetical protein